MLHNELILKYALDHWHNNFTGISAVSIADKLGFPHSEVLKVFDDFESNSLGNLKRDVELYQLMLSPDRPELNTELVVTSIFFPSMKLLEESFYQKNLHKKNLPEYKIRLHKGYSQMHFLYFKLNVLKKYIDNQERYNVSDSVSGGTVSLSHEYIEQLSKEEIDNMDFGVVRFGKRVVADGNITVVAILSDLAGLSDSEQSYWHSYEMEEQEFAKIDPDFSDFFRVNFLGEWNEYDDPIRKCLEDLEMINSLFGDSKLFLKDQNLYLSYPVVNTNKDFCDSCSELYKLIGPDNIKGKLLQEILMVSFGLVKEDFIHSESGRPLSKLDLLKLVAEKIGTTGLPIIIDEVKEHRISADHKILSPKMVDVNYITKFRKICTKLHYELKNFADELKKII